MTEPFERLAATLDDDARRALAVAYDDFTDRVAWAHEALDVALRATGSVYAIDVLRASATEFGGGIEAGITYRIDRATTEIASISYPR